MAEEGRNEVGQGLLVSGAHQFTARMHGRNGNADIHGSGWGGWPIRGSPRSSRRKVGAVHEDLIGDVGFAAQAFQDGDGSASPA